MTDAKQFRAFRGRNPSQFSKRDGPLEYTGWQDENWGWKNTAYLGDWSYVPTVRIEGPDALKLFSDTSINSFENFPIGKAKHCVQCDESGKVVNEGVLVRYAEDQFQFDATTPQWAYFKMKTGGYNATATFPSTHKLQISGPRALEIVEELANESVSDVAFMATKKLTICGKTVYALRQGMGGDIGFELHGPIEQKQEIEAAILEVGAKYGIRQRGWRWMQINHLESYFPTSTIHYLSPLVGDGHQDYKMFMDENLPPEWVGTWLEGPMRYAWNPTFTGSWDGEKIEELMRSPVELGWGRYIKFDHKFLGDEALRKELEAPKRIGVTLEFNSDDMIRIYSSLFEEGASYHLFEMPHSPYSFNWVDKIVMDGREIGHSVYPGYSPTFKKALAIAFIDIEFSTPGTEVKVLWGNPDEAQTELRAIVRSVPYKSDESRRKSLSK
ncbi:Aminomethyltransferase [Pseudomonas fluorescens]|uniref:Aminomethyltransferase n=1 Tax=Pseudomonas fluorescens TaxID=294 RepID=A0A5E6WLQ9_PSEFL|nr:glycine cleavage T C-terminal barrel domain-containing protein [Pseudomonas fluorescens]VVN29307.1 Aminomethyltransferase [Pseudomonas fluorescens]